MMKISNETKVGSLAAISITLLILGFNFLKGKNVFQKKATMYITFNKTEGLNVSDPVKINGLKIGAVEGLDAMNASISNIVVAFHTIREINIPKDSYAKIIASPLGTASIDITFGESKEYLQNGDTLSGMNSKGIMEIINEKLDPTLTILNRTMTSLDSTVKRIGDVFDEKAQQHIGEVLKELAITTNRLSAMLEPGKGSLSNSIDNLNGFTKNLTKNNDSITATVNNLTKVSRDIASANLNETIGSLSIAAQNLNAILTGIKEGKGSLGKLTTDEQLYLNLNRTANSLNILLQDLRVHPKRYVNVSVFGKKDKTGPLNSALPDSLNK